ncbi:uncharacterized protein LOC121707133 isoform X2 [Alosa sapidissima]|uniref:uncharacterized protein LOC121707133 isoform X2 n=1 Tax=Alosa sapidissima TaxID=34773 RepID=UPI001C097FAB|nr:uncharacterized protein LOC121707133 isoform X2 [Alosa sapidissima]
MAMNGRDSQGDHRSMECDVPGSNPPTGPPKSAAVGPSNQGTDIHHEQQSQMQQDLSSQADGEAAPHREYKEMSVDEVPTNPEFLKLFPTTGSSSGVVDPAVTQAHNHSDTPQSSTISEQQAPLTQGNSSHPSTYRETTSSVPKKFTEKPSEDLMQQSPPQDVAAVLVQIKCKLKERSQKWQMSLQKALQTFCSKLPGNVEICRLHILDTISEPFSAKIIVNSSSACEMLLTEKTVTLKLKDINEEATVNFKTEVPVDEPIDEPFPVPAADKYMEKAQEIPITVSAVVDVKKYDPHLANELLRKFRQHITQDSILTVSGTFEKVEEFYKEFRQVVGQPITSNTHTVSEHTNPDQMETSREISSETLRVPLYQYWYLNHMHRKEIESIEEKHGVTITADVCVSVEETTGANSKSVTNASQEFQEMFLKCAADIVSVPVPSVVDLVKEIQSLDDKLMLNTSAQNGKLVGPRNHVAIAQRELNLMDYKDDPRSKRSESARQDTAQNMNLRERWDAPKVIEMNIKDPLLSKGLHITNGCLELMKKAFKKQIKDIENKFGVDFQEKKTDEDVTITAQTRGNQIVNLEMNALRALMSLYQKAFTTTMYCPLQNASHNQTEMVKKHLSDIREQNSSLVVADGLPSGVWMMIGLPDHLRFAVSEIEKRLPGPVFDEKHKDMIGYERGIEFLRPYVDGLAWEAVKGNEEMEWEHGAAGGEGVYEKMGEQGGAGWKANRGFEGGAEGYGSSVYGATSTGLYGEEERKLGSPGRKAANGYEGQEQRETGSREGPNGNHKGLSGGKDGSGPSEDETCPICMDEFTDKEKLSCGHAFCKDCLRQSVESMGASCPVCKKVFGKIVGDQPNGTMTHYTQSLSLPGFKRCGSIVINYQIPSGIQSNKHPKPGKPFQGTHRTAYLPDNREGREVLALLKKAFDQRLIFTVGTSRTSGTDDCVTWNDVHHKTNIHGGAQSFGYPDDDYLKRVRDELKAKGIE